MQITIKFKDDEARTIKAFLCQRYDKNKNTSLETLAKIAIRQEVANEARKDLEQIEREISIMTTYYNESYGLKLAAKYNVEFYPQLLSGTEDILFSM